MGIDNRASSLHRHLDKQISRLETKTSHNAELIRDLKKQKLKIKDRLDTISIKESKKSKKEIQSRYKNIQLDLFLQGQKKYATQNKCVM